MPSAQEIATAVWNEPCVSEVDGETYPVGTFIHSIHGLAYQGIAQAVWDALIASQAPAQNGQEFPAAIFLTGIHGQVFDLPAQLATILTRLDDIEAKL